MKNVKICFSLKADRINTRTDHGRIVRGSEVDMNLGDAVRSCRWKRGWSQRQLSEQSGVARQTISDAEQCHRSTSVAILVELLDAMGYELVIAEKIENGKQTQKYRIAEAVIGKTLQEVR